MKTITCDKRTLQEIIQVCNDFEDIGLKHIRQSALTNKCIVYSVKLVDGGSAVTADYSRQLPFNCDYQTYLKLAQESVDDGAACGLYNEGGHNC